MNDKTNKRQNSRKSHKTTKRSRVKENTKTSRSKSDIDNTPRNDNDSSWYSKYPQLVTDTARINFFNPLGNQISTRDISVSTIDPIAPQTFNMPGVCSLDYIPTIGYSTDFVSQVNIAARNIFTFVRSTNSGYKNYEAQDMMLYLLAMDSLYAFYAWMCRVYGTLGLYSPVNKYYPKALCAAYGVNFENLQSNAADFRTYINMFGQKIGSLVIPSQTTFAIRHQWMNLNVFMDAATVKGQTYVFNPRGFYRFNETYSDRGAGLEFVERTSSNCGSLAKIIEYGDSLINAIVGSEDAQVISGDLLKAFGTGGIFKLAFLPETYSVQISYSPEVLTQIHNATVVRGVDFDTLDIYQDVNTSAIISTPTSYVPYFDNGSGNRCQIYPEGQLLLDRHMISMPIDNPTPDNVMVATRLICGSTAPSIVTAHNSIALPLNVCGTEIVDRLTIYYYGSDGNLNNLTSTLALVQPVQEAPEQIKVPVFTWQFVEKLSTFDYHPQFYIPVLACTRCEDGTASNVEFNFVRDWMIQNQGFISNNDLKQMHEVALISELTWDTVTNATSK